MERPTSIRKYFPEEGVDVIIPSQKQPVDVIQLPIPDDIKQEAASGEFQPLRVIINLKVVEADNPNNEVLFFDPPIEIRVSYTPDDEKKAGKIEDLNLGFWDGNKWNRFKTDKHQFQRMPKPSPTEGGWGIIKVSSWEDPTIGWGK